MNKLNKFLRICIFILFAITFQGCFEILHYIEKNQDGSLKIQWMFSISSAFTKKEGAMGPAPGGNANIGSRIKSSESEFKDKLKGIADDLKFESIENDYETGVRMSFTVKDPTKTVKIDEFEEGLPIVPLWVVKKKQLIFNFRSKDKASAKKKKKVNKTKVEDGESVDEESDVEAEEEEPENNPNDPTQKIASMIMSSANYKIMLGNGLSPKKATMIGLSSKNKKELEILKLGDMSIVKVPFASILMEEKEGFDLVIQM